MTLPLILGLASALAILLLPRRHRPERPATRVGSGAVDSVSTGTLDPIGPPGPGAAQPARVQPPRAGVRARPPWSALGTQGRRRREIEAADLRLLGLVEAIAPGLRAGLTPREAVRAVTEAAGTYVRDDSTSGPGFGDGDGDGDGDVDVLLAGVGHAQSGGTAAGPHRSRAEHLLRTAWSLGEVSGAPVAVTAESVVGMLRESAAHRRRLDVAMAGPRATMRLLTVLPLAGPLLAAAAGVPLGDLVGTPAAVASIGLGLLLLVVGRMWAARLVAGVMSGRRRRPS